MNDIIDCKVILKLLCRPWFTRRWVIQEVVKAKHVVVAWGSKRLPWDTVYSVAWGLTSFNQTSLSSILRLDPRCLLVAEDVKRLGNAAKLGVSVRILASSLSRTSYLTSTDSSVRIHETSSSLCTAY